VADGTIFEKRGVVAASIVTHTFIRAANAMGKRNGFPDYSYAIMPNPIGNLHPDQIKQRAIDVLPQVLEIIGLADEPGAK
jgi:hypothetical protein